jgi:hypothetical protein
MPKCSVRQSSTFFPDLAWRVESSATQLLEKSWLDSSIVWIMKIAEANTNKAEPLLRAKCHTFAQ